MYGSLLLYQLFFSFLLEMKQTYCDDIILKNRLIFSIEKALDFSERNYKEFNADAVLGIIIAEAHLWKISTQSSHLPIFQLKEKATRIIEKSLPFVLNQIDDITNRITLENFLLLPIWKRIDFTLKSINLLSLLRVGKEIKWESLSEFVNDELKRKKSEVLLFMNCTYSFIINYKTFGNCSIDEFYKKSFIFNDNIDRGYGILHRLLFIQFYNLLNCNQDKSIVDLIEKICSIVLFEAISNLRNGFIKILDDLLLEQLLLCGQEGYKNFFNRQWINYVISIQKQNGCYSSNQFKLLKEIGKRDSNQISKNCTDHTTGLGTALLSLYLRHLY